MKKISAVYGLLFGTLITSVTAHIIDFGGVNFGAVYSFVLSFFIFFAISSLIYAVFQKVWLSWAVSGIPAIIVSIINFYKLRINATPFTMRDFNFADGMGEVLGFAFSQINVWFVAGIFILALAIFALFIFAERYFDKSKKLRIYILCIGVFITVAFCVLPLGMALSSALGYEDRGLEDITMENGAVTGLYLGAVESYRSYKNSSDYELEGISDSQAPNTAKIKPTVIFIMSESFFDVSRLKGVEYSQDPLVNFHKLKESYSSGGFISSTFCGGTGFVEMEFLTGLCSAGLKGWDNLTSLPESAYDTMPCITDVFKKEGYDTVFLHSYNDVLYNRPKIYSSLGFDKILFEDSFPKESERRGGYISDMALTDKIIYEYENRDKDEMMLFAISMENHQPYTEDKFETVHIKAKSDKLSTEGRKALETYIEGVRDADMALGALTEYFENEDEPVVIVFWGDHLPNLNLTDGTSVYNQLGFTDGGKAGDWSKEELMSILRTDYVVWDNIGLCKNNETIGSSMLGLEIMERLGFSLTDYFVWLKENVKGSYLMYRSGLFAVSDTEYYEKVPAKYKDMINAYSAVVKNIAYENSTLFEDKRGVN